MHKPSCTANRISETIIFPYLEKERNGNGKIRVGLALTDAVESGEME
jgi:hypothetical protein